MAYIDFEDLKNETSITDVAQLLPLQLKKEGEKFRAPCPACGNKNPRALAISTTKNVFFCHAAQTGGDQISLAAHVLELGMKEAALHIHNSRTVPEKVEAANGSLQPLSYLDCDHELVQVIGFNPDDAKALGLGYSPKGVMRGTVAVPLRTEDGTLVAYIGITDARLPKEFKFPESNVIPLKKEA